MATRASRRPSGGKLPGHRPSNTNVLAGDRFELRRRLGDGAYGTVYEAWDTTTQTTVALKVLDRTGPDNILRFKREFRALQGLHHRNLVQLRELIQFNGTWLLCMELVEGSDMLEYVRAEGHCNVPRLREVLSQLAQGLAALHISGRLHRDIKPSNVRVTHEGRVVLLDFGLVTDVSGYDTANAEVVGTAGYMAPEQAADIPLGPAADWYAVGVSLYEALTGDLPFTGGSVHMMVEKQRGEAPSPRGADPNVPEDLDRLCRQLLSVEPARRPDARALLRELAKHSVLPPMPGLPDNLNGPVSDRRTGPSVFIGRETELATLEQSLQRALSGTLSCCYLHGESGVGKTRLVQELTQRARQRDGETLLLYSRCYENETVPYKGLDGAVDDLSRALRKLPQRECEALLPDRAGLLPLVFPTLGRVQAISRQSASTRGANDPIALRGMVFSALRELLARLSKQRALIIAIDDFQWIDTETIGLLDELLRPPDPPAMLVVALGRAPATCPAAAQRGIELVLEAGAPGRAVAVPPLPRADATSLAHELMQGGPTERAEAIAQEAEGHPLFVETMVRFATARGQQGTQDLDLDAALRFFADGLEPGAAALLRLCCIAGVPVATATLGTAAELETDALAHQLNALKVARLVRARSREDGETLEPFHNRIRSAITGDLDEDTKRQAHTRLAQALAGNPRADREQLAHHWALADRPDQAARYAVVAGDQACEALAFDKAARLYRWALELRTDDMRPAELLIKLGDALANAGHCSQAADVLVEAVPTVPGGEGLELRRRAAEYMISAGRQAEGIELASALLASVGMRMPRTRAAAVRSLAWHSLRRALRGDDFVERSANEIPQEQLLRIDIIWSLASTMGNVDPLIAATMQTQHFMLAADSGETGRIAQAMALDVFGLQFRGKEERVPERLEQARALAAVTNRPEVVGLVHYTEGMSAIFSGRNSAALSPLAEAVDVFGQQCKGVAYLLASAQSCLLSSLWMAARWTELRHRYPGILRDVESRGDPQAVQQAFMSGGLVHELMHDRADRARQRLEQLDLSDDKLDWFGMPLELTVDLYDRRQRAHAQYLERVADTGQRMSSSQGWRATLTAISAVRHAQDHPEDRRAMARLARAQLKILARSKSNSVTRGRRTLAVQAALCELDGDMQGARSKWQQLEATSAAAGEVTFALAARVRAAQIAGQGRTRHVHQQVHDELQAQGIERPLRLLHALTGGIVVPAAIPPGMDS